MTDGERIAKALKLLDGYEHGENCNLRYCDDADCEGCPECDGGGCDCAIGELRAVLAGTEGGA